jgi:hypothetical protein
MMKIRWQRLRAVLVAAIVVAGAVPARASDDGLVLRAVGFFMAEASGQGGTCTIPSSTSGIPVTSDVVSLSNTDVYPSDSCSGFVEMQNVMTSQGIGIDKMNISLRIAGANRFRQFVPTRNGFPTACRNLRKSTIFAGAHLFPVGSPPDYGNTGAGVGHLAFVQLLPMIDAQTFGCLREQYSGLPSSVFASLPLVVRVVGHGISDSGQKIKSNAIEFTLTLLHLCGNGRVDRAAGETCDPNAPDTCAVGPCDPTSHACRNNLSLFCQTDADCAGQCLQEGDPNECKCLYGGG